MNNPPIFTTDPIVFGLLMLSLGLIFYTSSIKEGFWFKFYKIIPALLLCYLIPALMNTFGLIAYEWKITEVVNGVETTVKHKSKIYYIASRFLLPAAMILLTLSVDIKAIKNLGSKALIMFFAATIGIVIGGPIAVSIFSLISPEVVDGEGLDAAWRGLSTIAGSWIGGGANQAAMLEIFEFNKKMFPAMVVVDVVVANIWMAFLLFGIGKKEKIDKWLKADNSAIESLKEKVTAFAESVKRDPTLTDYMVILGIAFTAVGISHFGSAHISDFLVENFNIFANKKSFLSSFTSPFFWMISIATVIGLILSFTKARNYEGIGASKIGSIFIYILVASIGMQMDIMEILKSPGLFFVGLIWMIIHVAFLVIVAKLIKAPYFFLAVGSKANIGGAASAPIVASAFHPSLATVGVLLAVMGYVIGTFGAIACAYLMQLVAPV